MKNSSPIFAAFMLLGLSAFNAASSSAQAIAPEKSAKAAAISDTRFIASSIEDNQDIMFLSQKAIDRAADARIKELAQQMLTDRSAMLYTMEQLKAAGSGSSKQSAAGIQNDQRPAAALNAKLSGAPGADFDSLWVSGLLVMHQAKYDELTQAKETVMNPQLKMAITEAVPVIRKHLSQLRLLQKSLAKMAIQKRKEAAMQKVK